MLPLTFHRLGHRRSVAPVPALEIRGTELFVTGQRTSIARYVPGYWSFANERWTYATCETRVLIQLEDDEGRLVAGIGPRRFCQLRDRFIFAGRQHVLTLLPTEGRWQRAGHTEVGSVVHVSSFATTTAL